MKNINELFSQRYIIIESMGYFNPLILEENNVVLTEGIVGGLVDKIRALGKMIRGWIQKLIDFVASKFKRNKTSNTSNNSTSTTTKTTTSNNQDQLDAIKKKMNAEIKVPGLEYPKKAISNIINDCKKAIAKENPIVEFKGKDLRAYFKKSEEQTMTVQNFLDNQLYDAYSYSAGKDCIDQLRVYQKALEASYKQLESMAEHVNNDKERSDKILKKAKGINQITQVVLKNTVSILSNYVDKITSLRNKYTN